MTRPVVLAEDAERDIEDARLWYAMHGDLELAVRFLEALHANLARIEVFPEIHPAAYPGIRRALVTPFPYLLLYEIGEHEIVVHRCIHARRDPARSRERRS